MKNDPQSDDMYKIAEQFVMMKGRPTGKVKEQMIDEVLGMIEDTINMEILSRMSGEQIAQFNEILEAEASDEDILRYIKSCEIDIDSVNNVALTKFRAAYIGA